MGLFGSKKPAELHSRDHDAKRTQAMLKANARQKERMGRQKRHLLRRVERLEEKFGQDTFDELRDLHRRATDTKNELGAGFRDIFSELPDEAIDTARRDDQNIYKKNHLVPFSEKERLKSRIETVSEPIINQAKRIRDDMNDYARDLAGTLQAEIAFLNEQKKEEEWKKSVQEYEEIRVDVRNLLAGLADIGTSWEALIESSKVVLVKDGEPTQAQWDAFSSHLTSMLIIDPHEKIASHIAEELKAEEEHLE